VTAPSITASAASVEMSRLRFDGINGVPASDTITRSDHSADQRFLFCSCVLNFDLSYGSKSGGHRIKCEYQIVV
jgi:hypothetical protein